jgi:hypothetical protein
VRKFVALFVSLFAAIVLAFMTAGTASASTTYTATTHLTNRLDGGHNTLGAPYWATDTLTRVGTLVDNGPDPYRKGFDIFSFSLSDTGTFVTNSNVGNPNGLNPTTPITGTVTGTVVGTGKWSNFDAPAGSVDAGGVPSAEDGNGISSSIWPSLFFHKDTYFTCPGVPEPSPSITLTTAISQFPPDGCGNEEYYEYTYTSCSEKWVDASFDNDGDAVGQSSAEQKIIGGISGAACPTPTPSPSGSTPPATQGAPTGAPQTGGGLPSSNPAGEIIGIVLLVAGLGATVGYVLRRVHRDS